MHQYNKNMDGLGIRPRFKQGKHHQRPLVVSSSLACEEYKRRVKELEDIIEKYKPIVEEFERSKKVRFYN
jgi:hypothetical protein